MGRGGAGRGGEGRGGPGRPPGDPRRPGSRCWRPLFRDRVGFLPPFLRLSHFFRFLQFGICLQPLHRLLLSGFSSDSPVF